MDYLRRMSRYDNELTRRASLEKQHASHSDLHIRSPAAGESLLSQQPTHFHSAHELHDEEKSKLVRSPELYNIDHVTQLPATSQRTQSDSALTTNTDYETSEEFLTILSKDTSCESVQQRLSTPYDDALEKESSPEQSESVPLPSSAFSDTLEPTSSCRRPLAFSVPDSSLNVVANQLVNQVIDDVMSELNHEHDESASSSPREEQLSSSCTTSSSDDDILEEDEYPQAVGTDRASFGLSMNKTFRRAQTNTDEFDIQLPPLGRRNSQSDTESYFRAISPSVHDYPARDERKASNEVSIVNSLQEGILRRNLQSASVEQQTFVTDPRIVIQNERPLPDSQETLDVRQLLDDLLDSLPDELSISISSEPLSSHSDAITVIFNSKTHSMDDEQDTACPTLATHRSPSTSSHSSSSHSVIRADRTALSLVHIQDRPAKSLSSLSQIDSLRSQRASHSSPGSFERADNVDDDASEW